MKIYENRSFPYHNPMNSISRKNLGKRRKYDTIQRPLNASHLFCIFQKLTFQELLVETHQQKYINKNTSTFTSTRASFSSYLDKSLSNNTKISSTDFFKRLLWNLYHQHKYHFFLFVHLSLTTGDFIVWWFYPSIIDIDITVFFGATKHLSINITITGDVS